MPARPLLVALFLITLILALFPVGWLGEIWSPFGGWLWRVFPDAWAHAAGHITIFCLLGLAALLAIRALRAQPRLYFGLMLAAGAAQEFFQLLYKQRAVARDDFRDLGTDLVGAALALVFARYLIPYLQPARSR